MKHILVTAVYLSALVLANPGAAQADPWALRAGDMRKLSVHDSPKPLPDVAILTVDEREFRLSDLRGQWLVVNFWATWCAPCRAEMPTLAALQDSFAGQPVEVVTIATGRNAPQAIARFFDEIGVTNLPQHRDPKQALAREMGVLGLPITVIVDPEGREVARLTGDADWHSESAVAILRALSGG